MKALPKKVWWNYLQEDLQELLTESFILLEKTRKWRVKFHDYSFVVFPAAKAYEGFLKKFFLDTRLISRDDYFGKRFRIGKSLNPSLDKKHQDEGWVYDDLSKYCQGRKLPDLLWDTWKESRNLIFHWFPNELNAITLDQAEERINMIINAIDAVFKECNFKLKDDRS
jgi:hypothetical protein